MPFNIEYQLKRLNKRIQLYLSTVHCQQQKELFDC